MNLSELKALPRDIRLATDTKILETEKEISRLAGDGKQFLSAAKIGCTYARSAHNIIAERHKK